MSNGFSTFAAHFIFRILSFFSHYGFVIRHFHDGEPAKTPGGSNG